MNFITLPPHTWPEQTPTWTNAALNTEQADPFCNTPTWQLAFHDAFAPERRLLVEESCGSVIAFAENIFASEQIFLTPLEPSWFFGCPLLGKDAVHLFAEALGFLGEVYTRVFPKIAISGIRPSGNLGRLLLRHLGGKFDFFLHSKSTQCSASLLGGVDGYLSRRSANHRAKLKKAVKKAREKGIFFERLDPSSPEEVKTVYSRMLAVERTSWKGIGRCGMGEDGVKEFYAGMMDRLVLSKSGRVIFARYEDTDIGFIFGAMAGEIYRGQQFSYTADWQDFSIGNLMQIEQIVRLCEEGIKRYDMGPLSGPRMGYKAHWTENSIPIQTWILEKI